MDLANDPQLRAVVEIARSWGTPLSVFLGRAPTVVTVHAYDDAGRLVRSETHAQPLWTADDREAAIALSDYERELCPGCQRPLSETTAPESEGQYLASVAVRCHRCTAQGIASETYSESPQPQALFIPLHRREPAS